jgi:hypothetical protein
MLWQLFLSSNKLDIFLNFATVSGHTISILLRRSFTMSNIGYPAGFQTIDEGSIRWYLSDSISTRLGHHINVICKIIFFSNRAFSYFMAIRQ